MEVLASQELRINGETPAQATIGDLADVQIEVIRRDDYGDEDFSVALTLEADRGLPDPRASLLRIGVDDPLTAALVTKGLPSRADRELDLQGLHVTVFSDADKVTLSNYLDTYRQGDGFRSFFVQKGGGRFETAPEDGSSITLSLGDRIVLGQAVYLLRSV